MPKNKHVNSADIIKHNNLIVCKYNAQVNEQKFLYKLFQFVQKNNIETNKLTIPFDDFFYDYKSIVNKKIGRKDFLNLILQVQRNIITIISTEENNFITTVWFKIKGELNFENVELILDPDVFKYIKYQNGGEFTIISTDVYSLNSFYTMRIYEILKRWLAYCIKTKTPYIQNINQLKEILMLEDSKTYAEFKNFNRKILKPSIEEINNKTDILVTYNSVKGRKRKVESLEFFIEPNPKKNGVLLAPIQEDKDSDEKDSVNENLKVCDEKNIISNLYIPKDHIFNERYTQKFKEYTWENSIFFDKDGKDSSSLIFKDAQDIFIDNKGINKIKNLANFKYFLGIFNNLINDDLNKFSKNL
ncbi:replication initiation protein [Clostridium perfringens]|uniref:replication initiation protein n=1 Tax=Clostridium perfringens TaxID=1502 RepID=UPI0018E422E5|nr:replication initiation protein [Clostridium perfringens]MBI6024853.1 replication initiation protein [Clostridium perfringens]MBI6048729.1 replication initiation protein [Clostridium perfringens]MDK0554245.1 replication initiation protein [Clostridium perfringens]MDK0575021.1 replication initiation protein [Clostridium perfringens]MDK0834840.1 replication initiation protein [Clostridium perfringens]